VRLELVAGPLEEDGYSHSDLQDREGALIPTADGGRMSGTAHTHETRSVTCFRTAEIRDVALLLSFPFF
jgi:hypothetical protein